MFKFYEVGGRIRDEILGLESKDYDYTAVVEESYLDMKMEDLFEYLFVYLEKQGFNIFLATKSQLTIRARFPKGHSHEGITADFVLARKELGYEKDSRKAIVIPGTLYDDLQRRDFTVNAIARDEDGQLVDPFNGLIDIQEKILRTPIKGEVTFSDDPLRLLRALRFAITKGFKMTEEITNILYGFDYRGRFHVVSEERIREELYKCLKYNTMETLRQLYKYQSLSHYVFTRTNLWLKPTNES
jgi:tRNA nucleotidyltransferase/poly(A) polymerase